MSNIKERIIGAVTIMREEDAAKVWSIIEETFNQKEWNAIPQEAPDEIDMQMLADIKTDSDCKEFVSSSEAMKELGL